MRVMVLTTQTLHHAHFLQALAPGLSDLLVLAETDGLAPAYETAHPFELDRDRYESDLWFDGAEPSLQCFAETQWVANANDAEALDAIRSYAPDMIVDFGTGRLRAETIAAGSRAAFLNLHGGNPEKYRGLDSHLWAIWHGQWSEIVTCLHRMEPTLDTGAILGISSLDLAGCEDLSHIRAVNTEACIRLTCDAIAQLHETGEIEARAQESRGRYYSFMPAVLKSQCVVKFRRFKERDHG